MNLSRAETAEFREWQMKNGDKNTDLRTQVAKWEREKFDRTQTEIERKNKAGEKQDVVEEVGRTKRQAASSAAALARMRENIDKSGRAGSSIGRKQLEVYAERMEVTPEEAEVYLLQKKIKVRE